MQPPAYSEYPEKKSFSSGRPPPGADSTSSPPSSSSRDATSYRRNDVGSAQSVANPSHAQSTTTHGAAAAVPFPSHPPPSAYYCAEHTPVYPVEYPVQMPAPAQYITTPPVHHTAYGLPMKASGGSSPIIDAPAAAVGSPPDNIMYIEQPAQYHVYRPEPACPTGMILFLVGFIFPIAWWIGVCVPSNPLTKRDQVWRRVNAIMSIVSLLCFIAFAAMLSAAYAGMMYHDEDLQ